jgi:hypothetical protein
MKKALPQNSESRLLPLQEESKTIPQIHQQDNDQHWDKTMIGRDLGLRTKLTHN